MADVFLEQARRITDFGNRSPQDLVKAKELLKKASEYYNIAQKYDQYTNNSNKVKLACQLALVALYDLNSQKVKSPLWVKQVAATVTQAAQLNPLFLKEYLEHIFMVCVRKETVETFFFLSKESEVLLRSLMTSVRHYKLTEIDLRDTYMTDEMVGWLSACTCIQELNLSGCKQLVEPPFDLFPNLEIVMLNDCTGIRKLRLPKTIKVCNRQTD